MEHEFVLDDGLGTRRVEIDSIDGCRVEVLEVAPALAAQETFEAGARSRAARLPELAIEGLQGVRRIERHGSRLRVVFDLIEGVRLSALLHAASARRLLIPPPLVAHLARHILEPVAELHRRPGGLSHGAITPAHVVFTAEGRVILTDAPFGTALEGLGCNREQLWRGFGVAMPVSATLPRFDRRSDVTQAGATILALALGRPLHADEYSKSAREAIAAVGADTTADDTLTGLRTWLQQALLLHARAPFATAVDAARALEDAVGRPRTTRSMQTAFRDLLRVVYDGWRNNESDPVPGTWAGAGAAVFPSGR